jgi:hypothetical protein
MKNGYMIVKKAINLKKLKIMKWKFLKDSILDY